MRPGQELPRAGRGSTTVWLLHGWLAAPDCDIMMGQADEGGAVPSITAFHHGSLTVTDEERRLVHPGAHPGSNGTVSQEGER